MTVTLYATVADLQAWLQGADDGSGTAAKLTPSQLTLALTAASTRVSAYFGSIMDSSVPQATPPDIFGPITLDLAAYYATRIYLKNKEMPASHPILLAYKDAMSMLRDVRDGKLRLDPAAAGGINETGTVINRIPPIFNGSDSNTRLDPVTGFLASDTPFDQWTPHSDELLGGGPVYQG